MKLSCCHGPQGRARDNYEPKPKTGLEITKNHTRSKMHTGLSLRTSQVQSCMVATSYNIELSCVRWRPVNIWHLMQNHGSNTPSIRQFLRENSCQIKSTLPQVQNARFRYNFLCECKGYRSIEPYLIRKNCVCCCHGAVRSSHGQLSCCAIIWKCCIMQ
jgi:hypothetical protein